MDACANVEKEIEKVLSKFGAFNDHVWRTLTDLIEYVQNIQREFNLGNEPTPAQVQILTHCSKKVKDVVAAMATEHRDLHGTVSKVGKAIDKNFIADFASTSNEEVFQGNENVKLLNQVISEHFLRQGMLEIAEELIKETGLQMEQNKREPFSELNRILDALKKRDLEPALMWAQSNRKKLLEQNSSLEFRLHRLHFIDLLQQGVFKQEEAIGYARKNFQHLAAQHEKDIQVLMGSLLYLRQGVQNSPYSYLLDPIHWAEIWDIFTRDACALLGLSVESPLAVCTNAGCIALPALLNIKQVMQQRHVTGVWNTRDELPIEIDLGKKCHFHSVFACPILRQQSSENNPPMRLVCGHVISRDALHKLANGNKLKCPYCPVEQNPSDARLIHF
ncbi:LOW QUALITY PROTEIN: E3 ubiquitin-protein ligase RMND5A-like [Uloborus diversus]|uniref:LOW QUALITY PROTEIN: E3 ubiquitin-protein ligase RMND5A-like n=1 Tax=Uloborus diversus TaxID=327109 RepID=UPI0024093AD4|nr:LOW QUALITY PROTEIN: E3 ubiquitin-protein ligase RMND5A-like [Uloborus diversus]